MATLSFGDITGFKTVVSAVSLTTLRYGLTSNTRNINHIYNSKLLEIVQYLVRNLPIKQYK